MKTILAIILSSTIANAAYIPPYQPPGFMGAPDLSSITNPLITPIDQFHFLNETWLVDNGTTMLVGVNDAVLGGLGGFISVTVRVYSSTDGGKTFPTNINLSDQAIIAGYGLYFASDPTVTIDTDGIYYAGGALLSSSGTTGCTPPKNFFGVISSTDGVNWSTIHSIAPPTNSYLSDRPMLVAGKYLWASWNAFNNLCTTGSPHVAVSYDKGITWHDHTIRVNTDYQPDLNFVLLNDTTAIVPIMLTDHAEIHSCATNSVRCNHIANLPAQPTPDEQFRLSDMGLAERINSMPTIAAHGNHLLIAWMNTYNSATVTQIVTAESTDGGITWSSPTIAYPATYEQFFPMVRMDDDIPSLCFYEESVHNTRNYDIRCGEFSGGWSWTTVASNIQDAPGPNSNFIGDYIGRTKSHIAAVVYHPNPANKTGYQPILEIIPYPGLGGCQTIQPTKPTWLQLIWFLPPVVLWFVRRKFVYTLLLLATIAHAQPTIIGDCDNSGSVTINDLVVAVNTVINYCPPSLCNQTPANDGSTCASVISCPNDTFVYPPTPIDCLISAINNALFQGCTNGKVEQGRWVCE